MKRILILVFILASITITGCIGGDSDETTTAPPTTTTAPATTAPPTTSPAPPEEDYPMLNTLEALTLINTLEDIVIVDVSPQATYYEGHIPEAVNYELESIDNVIPGLSMDRPYLIYCHSNLASTQAADMFVAAGFDEVYVLNDGYGAWVSDGRPTEKSFYIHSDTLGQSGDAIPVAYTCDGNNVNPPFEIRNLPDGTASISLFLIDVDGPGGEFVHWSVWDIIPDSEDVTILEDNTQGVMGTASIPVIAYVGPCPPRGDSEHRYFFYVYALDEEIGIEGGEAYSQVIEAMQGHILGESEEFYLVFSRG